jgi:hypothetical protein
MVLLCALVLFLFCAAAMMGEIVVERDWPRDTWPYVLFSALCVIASLT